MISVIFMLKRNLRQPKRRAHIPKMLSLILVSCSAEVDFQLVIFPINMRNHSIEIIVQPFFPDEVCFYDSRMKNVVFFGSLVLFVVFVESFSFGIMKGSFQIPMVANVLI